MNVDWEEHWLREGESGPHWLSVLLVDDHAVVRQAFKRILEDDPGIRVVGEAGDGERAVELAIELSPQVLVMDCALPKSGGLNALKRVVAQRPSIAVLMLSMYTEHTLISKALSCGARGYISKSAGDMNLVSAVKRVAAGEIVLDPQLSRPAALKGERAHGLTTRELEVLQQIAAGKSNKEIARYLEISVNTVGVHRANMMQVLGMHNAAGLAAYAIYNGLLDIL